MQRRSISIPKKCGCGCYVKVRYPQSSFPDLCPVSRKPFTADTAVHKAVVQQQHSHTAEAQNAADAIDDSPLISSQPEATATAETSSQSDTAVDQVQIWGQLQHTGHTPVTKESEKHLPIDEVSMQSSNNSSAILLMTPPFYPHFACFAEVCSKGRQVASPTFTCRGGDHVGTQATPGHDMP